MVHLPDTNRVQMPFIWRQFLPEATKEFEAAQQKYTTAMRKHNDVLLQHSRDVDALRAQAAADSSSKLAKKLKALEGKTPLPPPKPVARMHADELPLVLKLSTALKLLLASRTNVQQRERGTALLFAYLLDYKRIYGIEAMVPNHHYSTHIPPQLDGYATVYGMWAFLPERLNKDLKDTNLNNRRGGQQEVTMMREFYREVELRSIVKHVETAPGQSLESTASRTIATRFLQNPREARGTFEATATAGLAIADDAMMAYTTSIGTGVQSSTTIALDLSLRDAILSFYNSDPSTPRGVRFYHGHDSDAPSGSIFLNTTAYTLSYVVKDGRRITPASSSGIVKVYTASASYLAGDVVRFLYHVQPGRPRPHIFAEMRWMVPQAFTDPPESPWAE
ncbi:hypothetical protein BV20DRAFT_951745 [Pilatotrama ljubarskyi]|nr:hypothetical protein BV20DRAFT_951745 [Pilatotrama ljubarskyi]